VAALKTRDCGLHVAIVDTDVLSFGGSEVTELLQALREKRQCGMRIAEPDSLKGPGQGFHFPFAQVPSECGAR